MTAEPLHLPQLSLATTLGRVSLAIRDIGAMIADVETCILDDIVPEEGTRPVPPAVQQLDHALQMIDELTQLVQRLADSQTADSDCSHQNIIYPISLERLRNLITFGTIQEEDKQQRAGSDQISLF